VGEACAGLCRETWARAPSAGLSEADAARVRAGHPIWPRIINARHGKNGETRLMWAARTGRVARVRELCAWGADVNARSTRAGATALALASGADAADAVRELVARGAAVEAAQEDGRTSLLVACDAGALGAVRELLARGVDANVEAATPDGKTCLMRAAAAGCAAVVAELLVRGAKPDATSRDGSTALHFCCTDDDYVGRLSVSCVRALVAAGADVNAQDASGKTVLMKLACPCEFDERNADGVRALLALGANPNLVDTNGSTVLIECCSSGLRRMACALIDAGADVNIATRLTRTTALIEASRFGFNAVRIACALIAAGANIEHAAANGDTAYSVAADYMVEEKTDEQWAIRIVFDKIKSRLPYSCDSDDDAREVDAAGVRKITGEKLYAMIEASLCDDEARCFRQSAAASWS
jgi:ankyrin repeat protein